MTTGVSRETSANRTVDLAGITLSAAAAERVRRFVEKRGRGLGVRLGVRTTGCSGLSYTLEYVDEVGIGDSMFEDRGVKIVVDGKSLVYLEGTTLDFAREGLNEGFRFINPNEKARCGCGESFSA